MRTAVISAALSAVLLAGCDQPPLGEITPAPTHVGFQEEQQIREFLKTHAEQDQPTPAERRKYNADIAEARRRIAENDRQEALRLAAYQPSDVADCRSRANAAFAPLATKEAIMDDCLLASKLRRDGR